MKIEILVHKTIEIPDKKLPAIKKAIREHYGLDKNASIGDEDILHEAENQGLIILPDEDWSVNS